jgi:hypothetical protein
MADEAYIREREEGAIVAESAELGRGWNPHETTAKKSTL